VVGDSVDGTRRILDYRKNKPDPAVLYLESH
jgi:hypothetical protein